MRSCGVVVRDPFIQSLLGNRHAPEHLRGVELKAQGAMEALDLARRRGVARLREQMLDAVLATDPVEEHFDGRLRVFAGEHFAVVGEHLLGDAVRAQCSGKAIADLLGTLPQHQPCRDAEPRMIVDAGQCFGRGPVGEQEPTNHVQLPQLHRTAAFPALPRLDPAPAAERRNDPGAQQTAVHR